MRQPVAHLMQEQHRCVEALGKDRAEAFGGFSHERHEEKIRSEIALLREQAEELHQRHQQVILARFLLPLGVVTQIEGVVVVERPRELIERAAPQRLVIEAPERGDQDERQEVNDLLPAGLDLQQSRTKAEPEPPLPLVAVGLRRGRPCVERRGKLAVERDPIGEAPGEGRGKDRVDRGDEIALASRRVIGGAELAAAEDRVEDAHQALNLAVSRSQQNAARALEIRRFHAALPPRAILATAASSCIRLPGKRIGGVNVFGGGLALYKHNVKVGGVGVSGDSILHRPRHRLAPCATI